MSSDIMKDAAGRFWRQKWKQE